MAEVDLEEFLNGKPTVNELYEHVRVGTNWHKLGVLLKLGITKLNDIRLLPEDSDFKALKMFELWLSSNPNATRREIIETLQKDALKENTIAEEYKKASTKIVQIELTSRILQKHSERVWQLILPTKIVHLLYTEGVISKETYDDVKILRDSPTDCVLKQLRTTVSKDPNQLRVFASILLRSRKTVQIAQDMLKEYEDIFPPILPEIPQDNMELLLSTEHNTILPFPGSVTNTMSPIEVTVPTVNIQFDQKCYFTRMRIYYGTLIKTVTHLIKAKDSSLEDLKSYLLLCYSELRPQLENAQTLTDIMIIVKDKNTIIDIEYLEAFVDYFNIQEAKDHIVAYKIAIEEFCEEITLNVCFNESFAIVSPSLLKCDTVEFVLDWKADDHSLCDIRVLLRKAFNKLAKNVHVRGLTEEYSITVTCYAPQNIMDILLMEAEPNLDLLRSVGLIKLTIGYHTLWDGLNRDQELRILDKELVLLKEKLNDTTRTKVFKIAVEEELESVCHFLREREGEIQKLKSTLFESKVFSTADVHVDVQEQSLSESELHMQLSVQSKMSKAKTLEIEKFTREKEATDKVLVKKQDEIEKLTREKEATDKVLVEKQEEIEKLTREKEATDKVLVEKQEAIEKLTREKEDTKKEMEMPKEKITSLTLQVREQEERSSHLEAMESLSSSDSKTTSDFKSWMPMLNGSMRLKGYRKAVIAVFDSHFDILNTVLEGYITSFIEKVLEARLISRFPDENYGGVYAEIKARLEFPSSAQKLQTYYQHFLGILDNLGKPTALVGKRIGAQLSTLTDILNLTSQYDLQFESLEEECDDDLITDIAKCIDDYKRAGHVLGLSEQTLDSISQSKQSDVDKKNAVFMVWKRNNGTAATSMKLVKAFLMMKDQYVTETIFKYHSKKSTSLPEIHPIIPNWDDLIDSEKEAVRKILIDENRSVREAYAIFVTQLMESFMERNIKPGIIWSLIHNYGGFKHSRQYLSDTRSQQHPSDDSITAVFSELSKRCTWFNYELFQFILKVKGNEAEKMSLKIYVDEHFIPYLKHSVFEGKDIRRQGLYVRQHHLQRVSSHFKLLVPKDLYEAGRESKAIKQNITQLLDFKNDTLWDFVDYNEPHGLRSHYYEDMPYDI